MNLLIEIQQSKLKPKELNKYISQFFLANKISVDDLANAIHLGKDAERGTCIEALEYVTQTNPQIAKPYVKTVIDCLQDQAPRVKWEAARVIANIAKELPKEVEKAIPNLLQNTKDKGTVVRWSTALALGEIAKSNKSKQKKLIEKIENLIKTELNTGVKNVYLKALHVMGKQGYEV